MNRTTIQIPIGDWSEDGHSRLEWFTISVATTLEAAREAHYRSRLSGLDIESLCSEPGDNEVPASLLPQGLKEVLVETESYEEDSDTIYVIDPSDMSTIWVYLLNQADPSLDAVLEDAPPCLTFFGSLDGRRIGHVGYGCFG